MITAGNFIIQFILLSFLFGIPMLCFHGCLGQFLGSNIVDMWRISPIFKVELAAVRLRLCVCIECTLPIKSIEWARARKG